ncbi:uncharacterized protein LOC115171721 [Salmo trutta]|uniref:uncharacterized protein LOC115171721 n=1 Tax=Salmo trutta TaxID=8032 RepID=UPI0011307795|nr:uncharacterized protein LOC115171721 [Salmo trutta]XP_029584650.1 uncharacterized protein LOC115171721 [Salmo trutta]
MALVFSLSTLMFVLITGMETSKSLSQDPELKQVIQVESGKDTALDCSVKFSEESPGNVNIEQVVLWRLDQNDHHKGEPVFKYNQQSSNPRMPLSPKYQLSMPPSNERDKVVSISVKETQPEDEGPYECVVNTDSGNTHCNFMLNVTVPDQHQVPENAATLDEIPKNSYMSVAAVFVVVGSLAIGLLLLKLFQARRLRQHEPVTQEVSFVAEEPEDTAVPAEHDSSTRTGLFL